MISPLRKDSPVSSRKPGLPQKPVYRLASLGARNKTSVISLGFGVTVGGRKLAVMAGPCAVESAEQLDESAMAVCASGAHILRGGAFKPRSSPYSFQGMEDLGLKLLAEAKKKYMMPVVTEVMDVEQIDAVSEYADCLQIGARNIQNFTLLKHIGKTRKPVLLKRGMATTIDELLLSAEYILSGGNEQVILCERGIRTFETATRNTLDLSAIPVLKERTHLPVIVDPSHATGFARYVEPMAFAAIAAGADGLMIEVHPCPEKALCDGDQSLTPEEFSRLMNGIRKMADIMGREV